MCDEFDEFPLSDVEEISESDISEAEWDEVMDDMDVEELSELKEELENTSDTLELPEFEPDAEFYENLEPEETDLDVMLGEIDTHQAELEEMLNDTDDTSEEDGDWQKVLVKTR